MAFPQAEDTWTLAEAARSLSPPRSPQTLYRWATRGLRGTLLRTHFVGGRRVTTREDLAAFLAANNHHRQQAIGQESVPHDVDLPAAIAAGDALEALRV